MKRTLLILFFLSLAGPLSAQSTGLTGFDLRLFRPPSDGSGFLNLHGSGMLEPWKIHTSLTVEHGHGLLAATNSAGQQIRVVNDQMTANMGVAVGFTDFLQAGLNLPAIPFDKGRNFNTTNPFTTSSLGDVALDLKFGLLRGELGEVALLSETTLPTGSTDKFTGYRTVSQEGKLIIEAKRGPVTGIANAGYRTFGRTQVSNLVIDDMLTFGGGLSWTLPTGGRSIDLMVEADGGRVLRNSQELTTPFEWLAGIKKRTKRGWVFQVGGGKGITNGVGGGEWRVLAGIQWRGSLRKPVLLETIYFRFDNDEFLPKYESRLRRVAEKIKAKPKKRVKIRGHADGEGTEDYNLDLSGRRAERVKRSLLKKNVPDKQLKTEAVGEKEPVGDKAKDRRVEILQTGQEDF